MDKVLYVGYYDILRNGRQVRNYSLAAAKKMTSSPMMSKHLS